MIKQNKLWGTHRFINPIFTLQWEGWEAQSIDLQRFGWKIAVLDLVQELNQFCFILHQPTVGMLGISETMHETGINMLTTESHVHKFSDDIKHKVNILRENQINVMTCEDYSSNKVNVSYKSLLKFVNENNIFNKSGLFQYDVIVKKGDDKKIINLILEQQNKEQEKIFEELYERKLKENFMLKKEKNVRLVCVS